jgi:hypothetical protein
MTVADIGPGQLRDPFVELLEEQMTWNRQLAGYGIVLLAFLGLFLCLSVIIGAWVVKSRVDAVGLAVFQTADEALGFLDIKLGLVSQALERSRDSVGTMARNAARLQNAEADVRQECESLLQTLDGIRQELKSAESWLDSSIAIANGISRVSMAAISSEYAASRPEAAGWMVAREVQVFVDSVIATLAKLQALRMELTHVLDTGRITREVALGIVERVAQLDQVVTGLNGRIDNLDAKVATARASCKTLGQKLQRWNLVATVVACTISLWFGISQILVAYAFQRREA